MRGKVTIYTVLGFLIQLCIIASLAYWYTLLVNNNADKAIELYVSNFSSLFRSQSAVMLTHAVLAIISMLFYAVARKLSKDRSTRNVLSGLIFFDAIILLLVLIALF
jgi:hypothetical protein